jgi:hypothetical protein
VSGLTSCVQLPAKMQWVEFCRGLVARTSRRAKLHHMLSPASTASRSSTLDLPEPPDAKLQAWTLGPESGTARSVHPAFASARLQIACHIMLVKDSVFHLPGMDCFARIHSVHMAWRRQSVVLGSVTTVVLVFSLATSRSELWPPCNQAAS